jgi:hypothetical protein
MTDFQIRGLRTLITSIRALRREHVGGATIVVRFVCDHEALHRQVVADFRFSSGRLIGTDVDTEQAADVIFRGNYAALHDYMTGAISIAECLDAGLLRTEGSDEPVRLAVAELDCDVSSEAIEATDRGFLAARLAVMQTGVITDPIMDPDFVLRPQISEEREWQADLVVGEWERRTALLVAGQDPAQP